MLYVYYRRCRGVLFPVLNKKASIDDEGGYPRAVQPVQASLGSMPRTYVYHAHVYSARSSIIIVAFAIWQ